MTQWVKDPALSLLWLRPLPWLAWELPHAAGLAKENAKQESREYRLVRTQRKTQSLCPSGRVGKRL